MVAVVAIPRDSGAVSELRGLPVLIAVWHLSSCSARIRLLHAHCCPVEQCRQQIRTRQQRFAYRLPCLANNTLTGVQPSSLRSIIAGSTAGAIEIGNYIPTARIYSRNS